MPGIVGYVGSFPEGLSSVFLEKMAHALEPESRFKLDLYQGETIGLGRVTLGIANPESQPIWNEDETICLVMEGEIYDVKSISQSLIQNGHHFHYNNDAEVLLHLYEEQRENFAIKLNGAFVAAIWDSQEKKLVLVNDRLGLYPLYYAQVGGRLIFSSGVRALLVDPSLPRMTDSVAIAELLTFDHVLYDRTLLEAVRLLPPASMAAFADGHMRIRRYWNLRYADPYPVQDEHELLEEFLSLLHQAVARRARHQDLSTGILLSGGLDSRFITAFLCQVLSPQEVHGFTWGIPGCDDLRFAREVSAITGARHHFFELKPDWLLEKANEAVRITDGLSNLTNLHALATIEAEARYVQVLYKGFMGDALMGFGQRRHLWTSCDDSVAIHVVLQVFHELGLIVVDPGDHEALFTQSFLRKVGGAVLENFISGLRDSGSSLPNDQVNYFYLTQRVPRMTVKGVEAVRSRTMARLPYTDNDLVEFALRLPPGMRLERWLMKNALAEAFPKLAQIPVTETGLPLMICARDVLERANRVIRWHASLVGLKWIPQHWQRHPYGDYKLWFRTVLRDWLEGILMSKRALERDYFDPEYVKRLASEHMSGADHTGTLGALLSIELWHRIFLDDEREI